MKITVVFCSILFFCLIASPMNAANIYSWTDENGVRQYSNTKPPEGVGEVEIIEERPHDSNASEINQERQRLINKLKAINQAEEEARKEEEEQRAAARAKEKAIAQKEMNEKVQAEKERLLEEIKRTEQLAVTPTFSLALKNSIIKQYKNKITLLEKSPEEYFKNSEE